MFEPSSDVTSTSMVVLPTFKAVGKPGFSPFTVIAFLTSGAVGTTFNMLILQPSRPARNNNIDVNECSTGPTKTSEKALMPHQKSYPVMKYTVHLLHIFGGASLAWITSPTVGLNY